MATDASGNLIVRPIRVSKTRSPKASCSRWRTSRARIARIRGVNVDGVVRTLLARGLVEETGATPSGARLYGTTGEFLEKMGMTSLSELVPLAPYLPSADALDELEEEL